MFPPVNWSVADLSTMCHGSPYFFNANPRPTWIPSSFGFAHVERLQQTSRILWAYGELDPWATLGLKAAVSNQTALIRIPGGSHCADMEGPNEHDTVAMRTARQQESEVVGKWLAQVVEERPK
eukprot:m.214010 g.214010  ORF g.214010 m.214010 type:complete len:123 (-) comp18616_c1_seq2:141-509(-)